MRVLGNKKTSYFADPKRFALVFLGAVLDSRSISSGFSGGTCISVPTVSFGKLEPFGLNGAANDCVCGLYIATKATISANFCKQTLADGCAEELASFPLC